MEKTRRGAIFVYDASMSTKQKKQLRDLMYAMTFKNTSNNYMYN